ncbi:MAG TPA: MerR family transcriptional regulator [Ktedonobacteraceae bacterium]|nr:MerR family transcriptional regulator [Ktedonobacteraceae bacterium]
MKRKPRTPAENMSGSNANLPKYTIGVVSQMLGLPPQMLRRYEEAGLLEPARQSGKNRLYSDADVVVLEEIAALYEQGVNAVGIRHIIQMRRQVVVLQQEVNEVRQTLYRYQEEHHIEVTFQEKDQ